MPRLLYIACHFPPMNASASLRARGFCRYLPSYGWDVTVLTAPALIPGPRDAALLDDLPRGVTIEPLPVRWPALRVAGRAARGGEIFDRGPGRAGAADDPAGRGRPAARGRRAALRRLNVLLVPDVLVAGLFSIVGRAAAIGRRDRVDAVMATSPPESALLAGALIARRLGKPFIVDLRDAWTLGPYWRTGRPALRRAIEHRQERRALSSARRVICVSDAMRDAYAALYPREPGVFVRIANGHDEADFEGVTPAPAVPWTLLHTGSLKSRERLKAALAVVDATGQPAPRDAGLRAEFAGEMPEELCRRAAKPDVSDLVGLLGPLSHRETVARLLGAHALLLLVDRGAEVVTGKLAEYLRAGRPILAIAPPDGEAARRLHGHPAAVLVAPDDLASLPARLVAFHDAWRSAPAGPITELTGYAGADRECLAGDLARELDGACGIAAPRRAPPPPAEGEPPRASVVLVTRDRPVELQRALESVVRSSGGEREIVVVDNGSGDPDAVAAAVAHAAPRARLIRLPGNLGVSAARNLGAREARGEILIFLDDDALFTDGAGIGRAERAFGAHPRMGILAARVVRDGGSIVRAEFPSRHLWRADAPGRAPYFCGCAFAVRRKAFEALGGFDEAFFFALEELDLSFRAAATGVEIGYEPGFEALHRPSDAGRASGGWFYHGMRSRCLLARKNLPALVSMSHMSIWIAYLLLRGLGAGQAGAVIRGLAAGLRDARRARRAPVSMRLVRELGRIGGRSLY